MSSKETPPNFELSCDSARGTKCFLGRASSIQIIRRRNHHCWLDFPVTKATSRLLWCLAVLIALDLISIRYTPMDQQTLCFLPQWVLVLLLNGCFADKCKESLNRHKEYLRKHQPNLCMYVSKRAYTSLRKVEVLSTKITPVKETSQVVEAGDASAV
ncbi:unnamed protein product [Linum tenue]|uniref:Uncharacterized protein n=1 Tax=Linum tenue TaxID=586396 RepID=A0AAV0N4P3_9ROSI|nr:unnamed protein product [Linum tenue]